MSIISVLINSYNYRDYIIEAVESALNQTRPPDEVLVIDDGSTDGSVELLTEKYYRTEIVKIIRQSNRGQLSAMAAGFVHATGDIFFLLDADDRYQPNHIETVMSVYESRRNVDFVFTGLQEFGARTNQQLFQSRDHYFGPGLLRSFHAEWIGAPTSALSCRRNIADALLPVLQEVTPRWRIRADDCLVLGSSVIGARKYFLAAITVDYRVHETNRYAIHKQNESSLNEHWFRTQCFLNRMHTFAGIDRRMLRWLHKEFALIPEPSMFDLKAYLALLRKESDLSWPVRLAMAWRMKQHYHRFGRRD